MILNIAYDIITEEGSDNVMKLKEKRHAYLQKRALDKAIYKLIGDYGDYHVTKAKELVFCFDSQKTQNLQNLEFNLPSKEEIINEAKNIYINFDESNIKIIEYVFQFFGSKGDSITDKDLILNANGSIILLSFSSFNSIEIKDANQVFVDCKILSDIKIKSKFVSLNSENNNLNNVILECDKINIGSFTFLYAKNINLNDCYCLGAKNISIKAKKIIGSKAKTLNKIEGQKIVLDADFIDIKDAKLKASEEVIIKNKSCTPIQSVCAPKIVYNDKDISNNDEIVMQKLRQRFISDLKEIKDNVNNNLENYVLNEQITEILKK